MRVPLLAPKVDVRLANIDDRPAVEALSRTMREVRQFPGVWERWGAWQKETYRPIVATVDDRIVGFHAPTYTKVYVTSYYQGVEEAHRGLGIGGQMLDLVLQQAAHYRCTRLKFKVARWATQAQNFWAGFNVRPAGEDAKYFVFDLAIPSVVGVKDLLIAGNVPLDVSGIPKYMLNLYGKSGVTWYGQG